MVDNWECGLSLATGRFVISLTDRSVLKRHALERVRRAIREHGADVYVWTFDWLIQWRDGDDVIPYNGPRDDQVLPSRSLIDLFLRNPYDTYEHRLPRSLNSCCSSELLREIRASTGGRVCLPVSPDFTMAFLTLVHRAVVVAINEPLFVWGSGALSNGGGVYTGTDTFRRFLRDLNKTEADLYNKVPVKTVGIHNSLCNDLMHLKALVPERFAEINLDLPAYFTVCHDEILEWLAPNDPLYRVKMDAWEQALAMQPQSVQQEVTRATERPRSTGDRVPKGVWVQALQGGYPPGFVRQPWLSWRGVWARLRRQLGGIRRRLYRACFPMRKPMQERKFRTPIEAVRWFEACEEWERRHGRSSIS